MDNFFKILISILILNLIIHLAILFYKNYAFVIEYITCTKSTWNPKKDRFRLFMSMLSFVATFIFTYDLLKSTELSLWDLIIYLILIFIIQFVTIYVNFFPLEKKGKDKKTSLLEFNKTSDDEVSNIYEFLVKDKRAILDFNSLIEISRGNNLEKKIKWIDLKGMKSTADSRSGQITYGYIFDLFHENFIKDGIIRLRKDKRKEFINFIIKNFSKNDQQISFESLNKSYNDWIPYKHIE